MADDMPAPLTPCEADIAYQQGVDSAAAARSWVDAALAVLTARIERGKPDGIEDATIRDARAAAAGRILRIMSADIDSDA